MPADLPVAWSARFEIPTAPRPKRRHRARVVTPKTGRPFASEYPDPEGVREEATVVSLAAPHAPAAPWSGPVEIALDHRIAVPASWPSWEQEAALAGALRPTSKNAGGDLDNLAKQILDALTTSGRWWADDGQITRLVATKTFAAAPSTLVEVRFLREPTREEWRDRQRLTVLNQPASLFGEPA